MNFADQGHLVDEIDLLIGIEYYWTFMIGKVQQQHEFHNLVMLESVFEWIFSDSLNAGGTENHVIHANVTHVLRVFATDRCNYENDIYKFWDLETLGIS